jgi:F-type H+-transporting ATPase subunit delta
MASSTRQSALALQEKLNTQSGVSLELAEEFFTISNVLQQSAQLRSLLSDPSAASIDKEKIVDSVFAAASTPAKEIAKHAAKFRWSSTRDLAAAFEVIGVRSIAAQSRDLDALQTELFEMQQLVAKDSELELALSTSRVSPAGKQDLVSKLLSGKVSDAALSLARQAVFSKTFKRFAEVIEQYGLWIAEFAGESVAHIRVARPLSEQQLDRLTMALAKAFGRDLQVNVKVDSLVLGGVHVTVNGEVIDGTVLTKLVNARSQLN